MYNNLRPARGRSLWITQKKGDYYEKGIEFNVGAANDPKQYEYGFCGGRRYHFDFSETVFGSDRRGGFFL